MTLALMAIVGLATHIPAQAQGPSSGGKGFALPPGTAKGFNLPIKEGDTVRMRIEGGEFTPVSTSLAELKSFKLTRYREDGTPEMTIESPRCILNLGTLNASSPEALTVTHVDGAFRLSGRGFSWLNESRKLTVTNDLKTFVSGNLLKTRETGDNPPGKSK